jgi:NADH-quinone oxidoreductase subunit L
MRLIAFIPLLPAAGAAVNGLIGIGRFSRPVSAAVACGSMLGAFLLSVVAFVQLLARAPEARLFDVVLAQWIPSMPLETARGMGTFAVDWALRLDPLSSLMILVVTGIGLLIHVYSIAYMQDEPRGAYARYFCYLNLFCFFMLVLVLGANFLVMFVGWEGVGLCSYLLIGFWYEKQSASDAGKKAFIVNRIGDWGFVLGIFLVFFTFGTLDFRQVAAAAAALPVEHASFGVLSLIALLLFIGATGKSAQIPLFVWLPDAMEGPTPVSALIHAATMVTAGVYMVARNAELFSHAPMVMQLIAVIGVVTAFVAATIGLVQNDIKRVLAYSTVSQLGYMFLATGVGAFAAAMFHLTTHAFFKALLFLGSGSVIHAMAGEQNMQRMGGLKKFMPVTFATMMVGTLAIAGVPPLSGFFSKDEILYRTFLGGPAISHGIALMLWAVALATALMTAFYMFRLIALTFFGAYRGPEAVTQASPAARLEAAVHGTLHPLDPHAHGQANRPDHEVTHGAADVVTQMHAWHGPHESPRTMTWPLVALAAGAVIAGVVGIPRVLGGSNEIEHFLAPSFAAPSFVASDSAAAAGDGAGHAVAAQTESFHLSAGAEIGLMLLSVLAAGAGIFLARHLYLTRQELAARLAERWRGLYTLLLNKYYVDELYDATVVRATSQSARGLWTFDRRVVDGLVNAWGALTQIAAWCSHMVDKYVVDGVVNFVGWTAGEGSYSLRRLQTGLVQNYALMMLVGVFVFLTVYLVAR